MIYKVIGKHLHLSIMSEHRLSGAVQAASLASATSEEVGAGKEGKGRKMATGGKWKCRAWWSVLPLLVSEAQRPCLPQPSWDRARRPRPPFSHPHLCSSHCFSVDLYLCFSRQQICLKCLCSVYAALEGLDLCKVP